ncbi:mitochondrial glycerol-3-phosphate dehydrogenase, partial [Massospora cicadina]
MSRGRKLLLGGASALVFSGSAYYFLSNRSKARRSEAKLDPLTLAGPNQLKRYPNAVPAHEVAPTELDRQLHSLWNPPSREQLLQRMRESGKDPKDEFDLLVVGGGATGAGVALDAASRGLKVALVERDDYSAGTSSRSTKLVHGGVRYLEKAFRNLDYEQYKLVVEALHERSFFLTTAPHLSMQLPIMLPIYRWWQVPYFWAGSKVYDMLSGAEKLQSSYFLTRAKALEAFPMLKKDELVGAMVYYDGQHNDSRMNIALVLTAIFHGAVATNHTEVVGLIKEADPLNANPVVRGAVVKDTLTGESFKVRAKGVINATGPFTDGLRKMDDEKAGTIVAPSAGVHIVLPNYYSPARMGLLDPSTSDGRVIFFLPWQGNVVAGTTDTPTTVTADPLPREEEVTWILDEIRRYLSPEINVRRGDVLAAWSGIRPLVRDPGAKTTEGLVRNHMIHVSEDKLLTIAGGKWTTYRAMAEETVDRAIREYGLVASKPCLTESLKLIGAHGYSPNMFIRLIQHFGLETEVAKHLANDYGDRAWSVVSLSEVTGLRWPLFGKRLSVAYPYIEAEVRYAVRNEYACTAIDVLARRTRLSFLSAHAALEALPRVLSIMTAELGWDATRQQQEYAGALRFLETMGLPKDQILSNLESPKASQFDPAYSRAQFYPLELAQYREAFSQKDTDKDGHIALKDLPEVITSVGFHDLTPAALSLALGQAGLEGSASSVEFYEFLELLSVLKDPPSSPLNPQGPPLNQFTTDRSGVGSDSTPSFTNPPRSAKNRLSLLRSIYRVVPTYPPGGPPGRLGSELRFRRCLRYGWWAPAMKATPLATLAGPPFCDSGCENRSGINAPYSPSQLGEVQWGAVRKASLYRIMGALEVTAVGKGLGWNSIPLLMAPAKLIPNPAPEPPFRARVGAPSLNQLAAPGYAPANFGGDNGSDGLHLEFAWRDKFTLTLDIKPATRLTFTRPGNHPHKFKLVILRLIDRRKLTGGQTHSNCNG